MKVVRDDGVTIDLGTTADAPTIGITDFSRRVTDDFGVTTVVERGFARRMSVRIALPFGQADAVQQQLADLRATPALWVADDRFASLSVRGFYKDFSLDMNVPPLSYCTLTVEGLAETTIVADPGGDPAPEGMASTLRLIQPVAVTDAVLTASSVAETDHAEWAAGATYAIGARAMKAATHRVYESAADGNVGNDPAGPSGKWLDVGATNRWAMFDQALGSETAADGAIVLTLDAGAADALALLNVGASVIRVQADGYDRTQAVGGGAVTFFDLPGGPVVVTIAGDGPVTVGTLLIGQLVALGVTEASPTAGINDFSRKEVDDFGAVTVVQRSWAKRMAVNAMIRSDAVDVVANRIAAARARPALWIGDDNLDSLTVYGFFKDFSIAIGDRVSKLSLTVEGLSKAAPVVPFAPGGSVAWPDVTDPSGTKPADNADVTGENTSKDTNAVGGRPAGAVLALVDEISEVAIPAVNLAVATANERIAAARADADKAAADANARIDAADRAIDGAVRDFAAEVDRAQGADEALSRRIDSIVAESGGYDDRDVRALIASESIVRADDDGALGRRVDTVSASVTDGDNAVRADVKVTTDALARADEAFAQRAEVIEVSLGTVDSRIAAKAEEVTTAYVDADRALTQRIDSIVAEGGYDDRDVRAEITRVDTTAIDRDGAIGRRVDTVEATFSTGGGNMVANSDLDTTDGWSNGFHAPGGPMNPAPSFGLNAAGDPYHPAGENVLSIVQPGSPNSADGSAYLDWGSSTFPVIAGEYLQFSALVNCHRAQVEVILAFQNAAGAFFTAIHSAVTGPVNNGGKSLTDYARAGVVSARVPDEAVNAYLILRKLDTIAEQSDSYAWFLRPYVGAAREGQTAWNPYSVGRSSPVLLGTVARVKDTTDALARQDVALAERSQLIEASLGTVDARIGAKAEEVTRAYADADRALGSRAATLEAAASATDATLHAPGGVLARIQSNENTLADLPNRYAAASRTETLEAQLRGEAASGLGNTIGAVNGRIDETSNVLSARIEDRATAIADAKAGAVAQTVQTLRGEYNGTAATVQQQAAALAAADGRTSVYWEVVGTTGDGSTRVRLSKSDGQRGVFYVDADMIIDGSLLVRDSIVTDKIANQAVTGNVAIEGGTIVVSNGSTNSTAALSIVATGLGFVRVDVQFDCRVNAQGTTGTGFIYVRRTKDGVQTTVGRALALQSNAQAVPASFWFLDNPGQGPVTYDLVATTDSGNRLFSITRPTLSITETKK